MQLPNGIHSDVPEAEYHADRTRISKHGLDLIHRSPAHYIASLTATREPSPAMRIGTAIHVAVLEPERFDSLYAAAPKFDRRSSAGKLGAAEFEAAHAGKIVLDAGDAETIRAIAESTRRNSAARELLGEGAAEQVILWECGYTGARCRGRLDWLNGHFIVDLKTTVDASPSGFSREIVKYGYHRQAAMYMHGLSTVLGCDFHELPPMSLIAVEKLPPYATCVHYLSPEFIALGWHSLRADLETYVLCSQKNEWPSYPELYETSAPAWALKEMYHD